MKPAGTVHMWQQVLKELEVAFTIEDDHRYAVGFMGRTHDARKVLRDDVSQQCGLPGTGHAQHDALHDAHMVGPIPRPSVNVIAEHDLIPFPSLSDNSFILFPGDRHRRMRPLPFAARPTSEP